MFSIPVYVSVDSLSDQICATALLSANFHVRQRDVGAARKLLGRALGTCAKPCLFKGYIEMELLLGEVDRCRTLYQVLYSSSRLSANESTNRNTHKSVHFAVERIEKNRVFELHVDQVFSRGRIYEKATHSTRVSPSVSVSPCLHIYLLPCYSHYSHTLCPQKLIEHAPHVCASWTKFAELEGGLEEEERARAIFELAVAQEQLDAPEQLWKQYIDFELERGELSRVRRLYDRLLERSKHVKVWISRAQVRNCPMMMEEVIMAKVSFIPAIHTEHTARGGSDTFSPCVEKMITLR